MFKNIDIFSLGYNIQLTLDPYPSYILKSKYYQLVKLRLVSIENQPQKTSLWISNQHFYSVPKQIKLKRKLNEFTIDAAKKKTKLNAAHTL